MALDSELLSRIQFGFTIGFHILFPTFNLGLALFLTIMEAFWLNTRNPVYLSLCKFWGKIFALTFGMGVVSGIVLAYELGTNFGPFIGAVGGVLGPLFGYEVLSAFFLEAGFLGIMLFGWNKVGERAHFAATLLVMIGTTISAFWIMSANSWMQTPAGVHLANHIYVVDSWLQVVFNPSFMPRFIHMLMASYVTCSFAIAGIAAWQLLKHQHLEIAKRCFSFAVGAALILTPLQVIVGDTVGLMVHHHQPMKTAAMEGLWNTSKGVPLVLVGVVNETERRNDYTIEIPKLASLINTHQWDGVLAGLNSVPANKRPSAIGTVFYNFRLMVGLGFLMLAVALIALILRLRGRLYNCQWFLRLCVILTPIGFVSTIAGWMTAETGRQPWIVYGLMRTSEGASHLPAKSVLISLSMFVLVYGVVFSFYLFYLFSLIRKGPMPVLESAATEPVPFAYMAQHMEDK
jgi:cytochrome bd ubiquinol oxidase subunit I